MLQLQSKLPRQGVTIFSVMTELAHRLNALNLSQGFPDFPAPQALLEALSQATLDGYNQYPAGDGVLALREQMAQQFLLRDQLQLDPITEITITPGATIAIFCAIQACIHADDEVIIFDPSYDSYAPAIQLAGGKSVHIHLDAPSFQVNWQKVKDSINTKTRMIIVNTPHNPTGAIWSEQDWLQLIELIQDSRFNFIPSPGTYFQSLDYSAIRPDLDDVAMCQFLAEQHKIVAIPISVFYQQAPESLRLIRFCFAKTDATLQRAGDILMQC